jgi:hypothetical protein
MVRFSYYHCSQLLLVFVLNPKQGTGSRTLNCYLAQDAI